MNTTTSFTPLLMTPECGAQGCSVEGDQYSMVRCHVCSSWFCPEHISADEPVQVVRATTRLAAGLSYYSGICASCRQQEQPDSWLI
ncbi:MAG: hypothetical protein ABI068_05665 [Ktedonobacterales bacterium]